METNATTRTWLITGCSSGFGLALARTALAAGQRVVATARNLEPLKDLLDQYDQTCLLLPLDITQRAHCVEAVRATVDRFGSLDVLVNNAGRGLVGALEEISDAQLRANMETNFFGPINMMQAALPQMRSQRCGFIINMGAIAGFYNEMGFSIYGGAKFGIEGVSEALAAEVRPLGIKVMLVVPGPFRTNFISHSMDAASAKISDYEATTGKFAGMLASISGRQKGDPIKAAQAILKAVESDSPPTRLVLGKYAIDKVRKKLAGVEKDLAAWEAVGAATDLSPAST